MITLFISLTLLLAASAASSYDCDPKLPPPNNQLYICKYLVVGGEFRKGCLGIMGIHGKQ